MTRLVVLLLTALVSSPAFSQFAESGPVLNMLQKMQGRWRGECHAVAPGARYQQTNLVVNFTHVVFTTDEFSEPDCRVTRATHKARYRFVLRGPLGTRENIEAFAIDFTPEEIPQGSPALHPLNLIKYENGTLRFGAPPVQATQERLEKLDADSVFVR